MEMTASEMANEIVRHGKKSQSPDPLKARGSTTQKGKDEKTKPVA
jgi:hypothetical protein